MFGVDSYIIGQRKRSNEIELEKITREKRKSFSSDFLFYYT